MKAIFNDRYGPPSVLSYRDVDQPIPKENEVLVEVHSAATNPLDWHFMRAEPFFMRIVAGVLKPKRNILGADVAGIVKAVGAEATQFKVGDSVIGSATLGGFAEYNALPEKAMVHKPASLTFEQAAAMPVAGLTALQGLRDQGGIQPSHHVLINGASGGVGTFAVQLAKSFGATVTAVCSTRNVELVKSLGADHVVDYTQEDFTQADSRYDIILDNVCNRDTAEIMQALKPNGVWVMIGYNLSKMFTVGMFKGAISRRYGRKVATFTASVNQEDLTQLAQMMADEELVAPVDRVYPLKKTAEAIGYLETGRARGKVMIAVKD